MEHNYCHKVIAVITTITVITAIASSNTNQSTHYNTLRIFFNMERTMSAPAYAVAKRHERLKSTLLYRQVGTKTSRSLSCDVVFGSPNLGCRGTGICKLSANDGVRATNVQQDCKSAAALFVSLDGGVGAAMLLPREFLCVNILRNQFRHGLLCMESPCRIPNDIVAALGLKFDSLAPGIYPVEHFDGYFRIDFRKS